MALSRRNVILASLIAVLSWVLTTLWLPSFRLVPYAFFFGLFLAFAIILYVVATTARLPSSNGFERSSPASTYLYTSSRAAWATEAAALKTRSIYSRRSILGDNSRVSKKIDRLIDWVIRDFVKSWYGQISRAEGFVIELDKATRFAVQKICATIISKDLVSIGVVRLLPILNDHIREFNEAERAVRGKDLNRNVTESEELDLAIAEKYKAGHLHPAALLISSDTTVSQQQHLRRIVARLIPDVAPKRITTSASALILIKEIVACAVLQPLMRILTDPDFLNQMIEIYGRSFLHDRKTVRKLRDALDKHTPSKQAQSGPVPAPRLAPSDSERLFEKFIRAIRQCDSLPDARRYRSEIQRQIKRESSSPTGPDLAYLRRLDVGRKLLDQRISKLSSSGSDETSTPTASLRKARSSREKASLREVLYDASGLPYFMEFMDRLGLMTLVQFWIVVDGFRSPLDTGNTNGEASSNDRSWSESSRQDLEQVAEAYLDRKELGIPETTRKTVGRFLTAGSDATWLQYAEARRVILTTQDDVYTRMTERHFVEFKKSDQYFKWITSDTPMLVQPELRQHSSSELSLPQLLAQRATRTNLASSRNGNASSTDLSRRARSPQEDPRRSLDGLSRSPLFADDDVDPLANSTASLNSLTSNDGSTLQSDREQKQTEDVIQATLEDLMDEPLGKEAFVEDEHARKDLVFDEDFDDDRPESPHGLAIPGGKDKPSLSSLGLLGTPSRPTVFSQGDLFGENEKLWEEEVQDDDGADNSDKRNEAEIREAAPGDLGLAELVQRLTLEIDKLETQQTLITNLTRKAELTNNVAELRILRKSKDSLDREINRKELQRQQYIVQESDNTLYGRASITIKSIMIGTEDDGHEFALYVIEVQRGAGEKGSAASWAIARRYSEFHELHKRLRVKFPMVKELDFPRRQVMLTLQKDFLKKRRFALEKYLRALLSSPMICQSLEFRAFLSQQSIRPVTGLEKTAANGQDFVTRIYSSVSDNIEEFFGNVPVLDQLSAAGQNLISAASGLNNGETSSIPVSPIEGISSPREAAAAEAEIVAFEGKKAAGHVPFIQPICDAFITIFQLDRGNNWLRGRALVAVVQQLLGGTIERKVRESFKFYTSSANMDSYLDLITDIIWPGGSLRPRQPDRSETEKAMSRKEASLFLATLLPDVAGNVVGRSNAAKAGRRIFATLNNERLNQHLVYTLLDEVVEVIFGIAVV